jgi:hypothetical protein
MAGHGWAGPGRAWVSLRELLYVLEGTLMSSEDSPQLDDLDGAARDPYVGAMVRRIRQGRPTDYFNDTDRVGRARRALQANRGLPVDPADE